MSIKIAEYDAHFAEKTVAMWRESKEKALGVREIHSFEDHLSFLNEVLVKENTIFLAISDDSETVAGLMATDGAFLNQLYVNIQYQHAGIGSRLLELAKTLSLEKLQLYTFEINLGAQKFYEKHGFRIVGRGCDNEEKLPDILYEWCKVGSNTTLKVQGAGSLRSSDARTARPLRQVMRPRSNEGTQRSKTSPVEDNLT